jgi:hypothetical protein
MRSSKITRWTAPPDLRGSWPTAMVSLLRIKMDSALNRLCGAPHKRFAVHHAVALLDGGLPDGLG